MTPAGHSEESAYGRGVERDRGPRLLWQRALVIGTALCAVFLIGRVTAPEGIGEEELQAAEAALKRAEHQVETLELALRTRSEAQTPEPTATDEPAPTETGPSGKRVYVVQSGDTMRGIAKTFCGDPDLAKFVASFNGSDDPALISIGTELKLPSECDL